MANENDSLGMRFGSTWHHLVKITISSFEARGLDITFEQLAILFILSFQETSTQSEISALLNKDKSTILRQIDMLEEKKFLSRVNDKEDRRKKNLTITPVGVKLLNEAKQISDEIMTEMTTNVSKKDLEIFDKVLQQIQNNAQK